MHDTLKLIAPDVTVHGFRSAFRDFAGDETTCPREVAEAALAHAVGDKVEAAYRRSNSLAKRRELMDQWSQFLDPEKSAYWQHNCTHETTDFQKVIIRNRSGLPLRPM